MALHRRRGHPTTVWPDIDSAGDLKKGFTVPFDTGIVRFPSKVDLEGCQTQMRASGRRDDIASRNGDCQTSGPELRTSVGEDLKGLDVERQYRREALVVTSAVKKDEVGEARPGGDQRLEQRGGHDDACGIRELEIDVREASEMAEGDDVDWREGAIDEQGEMGENGESSELLDVNDVTALGVEHETDEITRCYATEREVGKRRCRTAVVKRWPRKAQVEFEVTEAGERGDVLEKVVRKREVVGIAEANDSFGTRQVAKEVADGDNEKGGAATGGEMGERDVGEIGKSGGEGNELVDAEGRGGEAADNEFERDEGRGKEPLQMGGVASAPDGEALEVREGEWTIPVIGPFRRALKIVQPDGDGLDVLDMLAKVVLNVCGDGLKSKYEFEHGGAEATHPIGTARWEVVGDVKRFAPDASVRVRSGGFVRSSEAGCVRSKRDRVKQKLNDFGDTPESMLSKPLAWARNRGKVPTKSVLIVVVKEKGVRDDSLSRVRRARGIDPRGCSAFATVVNRVRVVHEDRRLESVVSATKTICDIRRIVGNDTRARANAQDNVNNIAFVHRHRKSLVVLARMSDGTSYKQVSTGVGSQGVSEHPKALVALVEKCFQIVYRMGDDGAFVVEEHFGRDARRKRGLWMRERACARGVDVDLDATEGLRTTSEESERGQWKDCVRRVEFAVRCGIVEAHGFDVVPRLDEGVEDVVRDRDGELTSTDIDNTQASEVGEEFETDGCDGGGEVEFKLLQFLEAHQTPDVEGVGRGGSETKRFEMNAVESIHEFAFGHPRLHSGGIDVLQKIDL